MVSFPKPSCTRSSGLFLISLTMFFSFLQVPRPPLLPPRLSAPGRLPSCPKRQASFDSLMVPLTPPLHSSRPFQFPTISHVPSSSFDTSLPRALNPTVQDGTDDSEDETQSNDSFRSQSDSPPTSQSPDTTTTG